MLNKLKPLKLPKLKKLKPRDVESYGAYAPQHPHKNLGPFLHPKKSGK